MKSQYHQNLIPIFIYIISIGIYLHPLTTSPTPSISPTAKRRWNLIYNPTVQLDELHIMHTDQHDIRGGTSSSWTDAWYNDYWGRPLTSESSHKSWRPVSIWSFRFIKGGYVGQYIFAVVGKAIGTIIDGILKLFTGSFATTDNDESSSSLNKDEALASELFVHRIVNVLIHTAIVQLIGVVSSLLSGDKKDDIKLHLYTRYISQLLFALHPVHVEAVVNVANRPHILALLFNATIVDPNLPLLAMAILAAAGLLTAETAIFQFPAIVLTMTAIRYHEELKVLEIQRSRKSGDKKSTQQQREEQQQSPLVKTFINLLPRYILLVLISVTYLIYRHFNDTLSIPEGLIRPAENPFYEMTAITRVINYSYISSIHIMKSFGIDLVGFSHEYGYDCIPKMKSFHDIRLLLPVTLFCSVVVACVWSWHGWDTTQKSKESSKRVVANADEERIQRILLTLVFFSWIATLFPISGILKVGTFVADRIAVASSFGTCIFAGRSFAVWIAGVNNKKSIKAANSSKKSYTKPLKIFILFYICTFHLAKQTHNRAAEWMDSVPLFESSLKTCPRSIKSNLEMSKLYSGLVPHMLDLDKALSLISTAQSIDPEYCDVHQQYAHVYFQQSKYISFEEEMVQSLLCSFTMGQAMNNWNKYWKVVLNDGKNEAAKARYDRYMAKIRAAVENDQDERRSEEEKKRKKIRKVNDEL